MSIYFFEYGIITLYDELFQDLLLEIYNTMSWSYNPVAAGTAAVWASPRSLATTRGIIFIFSSYGY